MRRHFCCNRKLGKQYTELSAVQEWRNTNDRNFSALREAFYGYGANPGGFEERPHSPACA
jgi:hypothetical protein